MTVGAELAEVRRQLGRSLEEMSAATKIKVERLAAIEEMEASALPPMLYLRGFLRAYAAELHLDAADVTRRYLAQVGLTNDQPPDVAPVAGQYFREISVDEPEAPRPAITTVPRGNIAFRLTAIAVVALIAVAAGLLISANGKTDSSALTPLASVMSIDTAAASLAPAVTDDRPAPAVVDADPAVAKPRAVAAVSASPKPLGRRAPVRAAATLRGKSALAVHRPTRNPGDDEPHGFAAFGRKVKHGLQALWRKLK